MAIQQFLFSIACLHKTNIISGNILAHFGGLIEVPEMRCILSRTSHIGQTEGAIRDWKWLQSWRDDDPWDDWFYAKTGKLHSGESNAMHARFTYTELLVSCIKSTINYCILNLVYDTVELCAALAVSLKIKYQDIKKNLKLYFLIRPYQ